MLYIMVVSLCLLMVYNLASSSVIVRDPTDDICAAGKRLGCRSSKLIYLVDLYGCPRCYKGVGERCGGAMNIMGTCKPGSTCVYRLGSTFDNEKYGFCETDVCSGQYCGYRQRCVDEIDSDNPALYCKCPPYNCSQDITINLRVICGNDGLTYSNLCELHERECTTGTFIGINHFGPCTGHDNECQILMNTDNPCTVQVDCGLDGPNELIPKSVLLYHIPGCGENVADTDFTI